MLKSLCEMNAGAQAQKILEKFNNTPIVYNDIKPINIKDKRIQN